MVPDVASDFFDDLDNDTVRDRTTFSHTTTGEMKPVYLALPRGYTDKVIICLATSSNTLNSGRI